MGVVFHKSEFIKREDVVIQTSNRAFNYGDGFFETIKIINAKPFNFSTHYERYCFSCEILQLNIQHTEESFLSIINKLIERNNIKNGSAKIHISRSGGGKYLPHYASSEIVINVNNGDGFILNKPISLCFFKEEKKTKGKLSNIKSSSALVSVLAAIYAKERGFDNTMLLNTDGNIIETTNSNIFIVKNGQIVTPPISEGCVDGTMRKWVFGQENVIEKPLTVIDIQEANEVFTSNAIDGITPVAAIKEIKQYETIIAKRLQEKLISLSLGF